MTKRDYQVDLQGKDTARAFASNQRVSLKYANEICREIKGKRLERAEKFLQNILDKKEFLPLVKYHGKVPHRKGESRSGVKAGRYPQKVSKAFLGLLNSVKANADFKGLGTENLLIVHAFASQGFRRFAHQPKGKIAGKGWKRKSAHIEIVVREIA
ncbi:MAG: 50S ribosomal protein L22 [Candidatus ainarchaeum sp.]|nr:50S ribosomal protein L22 [Candidatus ainarchaeum sp.]